MASFVQRDITCNRCKKTYKTFTGEGSLSVLYHHTYFSVCPTCSWEIAKVMGYESPQQMRELLTLIEEAQTKNNHKQRIKEGGVCKKCELEFAHYEPRIRKGSSSNIESWHLLCY